MPRAITIMEPAPGWRPGAEVFAVEQKVESIQRKSLLYKSGAGENFYCLNHALGCAHGCLYPCYAFALARRYGRVANLAEWKRPKVVGNALELLDRELARFRRLPESVHLCLSTDPFMVGFPEIQRLSLEIIARINARGVAVSVLTKGLLPTGLGAEPYLPANCYGISLVSLEENFRRRWEPGAAPYAERIAALRVLHDRGYQTYAHLEPYPTPNIRDQDLGEILEAVGFADRIYFSGWNYNPRATAFPGARGFYRDQARRVREFCRQRGIECDA